MNTIHLMVGIQGSGKTTFSKKLSEKVLTRREKCDILVKPSRRGAAKRSLKTEQQRKRQGISLIENFEHKVQKVRRS